MAFARSGPSGEAIRVAIAEALSPDRRRLVVTAAAREAMKRAEDAYRTEYGREPKHDTIVDGRVAASLDGLNADQGVVAFRFGQAGEALAWIYAQLVTHSPVLSGRYSESHILLADGLQVDPLKPPPADRYVFMNVQPYSRPIEKGLSKQAPSGVYEAAAAMADRRFGNSVRVGFGYESPLLSYVSGAANRAERKAMREQPARRSAMRLERETRVPAITVTLT